MNGILCFFLSSLSLDLRECELLLQFKVLHLQRLVLAVSLALFQLNLLDKKLFRIEFGHGLGDLIRHELDLIPHRLVADFLRLLQGFGGGSVGSLIVHIDIILAGSALFRLLLHHRVGIQIGLWDRWRQHLGLKHL